MANFEREIKIYNWLVLRAILKLRVFNVSVGNGNVPILVKVRGQVASGYVAFQGYGYFPPISATF